MGRFFTPRKLFAKSVEDIHQICQPVSTCVDFSLEIAGEICEEVNPVFTGFFNLLFKLKGPTRFGMIDFHT